MAGSLTPQKSRSVALTCQLINSNSVAKGPEINVSGKWAGTLKVRLGRTTTTSCGAAELRLEGGGRGSGGAADFWTPIYPWTTALHGTAPSRVSLTSNAAANANTLDGPSGWTGISASDGLVFFYESGTVANSEWGRVQGVATSILTVQDSLTRSHATGTPVIDQAEEWSIPVDLASEETVRLVVDLAKNSVNVPMVAEAVLITHDATYYS
jgi:hypothetical protein